VKNQRVKMVFKILCKINLCSSFLPFRTQSKVISISPTLSSHTQPVQTFLSYKGCPWTSLEGVPWRLWVRVGVASPLRSPY